MVKKIKKLLIIGGKGFIGSHVTNIALQKGYEVTVLSLKQKDFSFSFPGSKQVNILRADLTKLDSLKLALTGTQFQYVINCSGYIDHTLFQNGGRCFIEQHFTSTMNLVECLNREHLESFIQIGSSDEYGNQQAPQREDYRESPISPYSFGKVASTHFLQMLHQTENFPVSIARVFLAYGPGQSHQRFLPQIIKGCLLNNSFPTSEGRQLRDFCYIVDIVEGIFKILDTPKARGNIINLASGKGISIHKVIETICQIIGKGSPQFGKIPYRPGENMELFANIQKAKDLLGWIPSTPLEEGLKNTIQYQERFMHDL